MNLTNSEDRKRLGAFYRNYLLNDVIPFWLRHGVDHEHGGYLTAVDRDGTVLDTDKSIWFQGRGAWMFATLFNTMARNEEWLEASRSGIQFLRSHAAGPNGKLYFSVTREGKPLRMRRYVYSEAFAAIACAAYARAAADERSASEAIYYFENYLAYSFTPGRITPKVVPQTRDMMSLGPFMIGIVTAQELREQLGDITVQGRTCSGWIDWSIQHIEQHFFNEEWQVLLENTGKHGIFLDHFDGRILNPGHALECAWFIIHEGRYRSDPRLIQLGLKILDWMWVRGWDPEFGGIFYYRDLRGLPVQEYWHDMKFWWPHCEAIIASLLAWVVTNDDRYANWHEQVHNWSFQHFPDPEFGEWYGYLHRDGRISVPLKGNMWKGPFHLPRMLWYCWRLLKDDT